ncbi:hypothetical protein JCM19037_3478 [Geomicrobium sp. JCM 19037]|uniref:hypothetical protein n=1 Tax=Geomicrobium sp. JCM 19037 TaxID=1460634 RepID=UPI00045F1B49|nr:hypothetical protein [Geomicrobium sp. JCM 19037]GAK05016.1 hypothetical protein JCM19037_3478 [Geomicrobium sp. JCM 19037]
MYIDIDFLLDRTSTVRTVEDMDQVREELDLAFHDMSQKRWVNVSFTRKKKWAGNVHKFVERSVSLILYSRVKGVGALEEFSTTLVS